MARIGRRFVPQSTIDRRVQRKDDRYAAELRRRQRHPLDEPVVEIALIPKEGPNNAIVIDVEIVPADGEVEGVSSTHIPEGKAHKSYPKPSTKVDRAIAAANARLADRRKLVAWAFAVKTRDQWRDRKTGKRLLRTLNLDPLRAEAHHIVSKDDPAVRYDVRNGITLSLVTHDAVERGLYRIEGTAWFTVNGVTYIDATFPVRFVRT